MMVSLQEILAIGEKRLCAIPAFNVYNLETALGVANAAREAGSPVIFQVYSRLFDGQNARYLAPSIVKLAEDLPVPAAFHLDHGAGFEQMMRALRAGATGIMVDASNLPLEENIKKTKTAAELCAACGVGLEGELGHIGSVSETLTEFTKPDEAERYAKETGICALAILVGNAHGRYKQSPKIDIDRIAEIRGRTKLPLVLHGGTGIPDEQVRSSIKAGIRKINFGTDLCYSFLDAVFAVSRDIIGIDTFMKEPIDSVRRYATEKIRLLGSASNG